MDRSRAGVDGVSVRAKRGGANAGSILVDRGKPGSKHHLVVDRNGVPLAVALPAANVHDSKLLDPPVDAVPPIVGPRGRTGRPRFRPAKLHADKAYDSLQKRHALRFTGIAPRIARHGTEWSERLGRYRWIVERTPA